MIICSAAVQSSFVRQWNYMERCIFPYILVPHVLFFFLLGHGCWVSSKSEFVWDKIARRLLGKILIDLRNTREEAISVAELKNNQDQDSKSNSSEWDYKDYHLKHHGKNEDGRRSSTTSDKSIDQEDDDDKETKYRLDPK